MAGYMKKFFLFVSSFIIIGALGVIGYFGVSDNHKQLRTSWSAKEKGATRTATALAMEFEKTHIAAIFGNAKAQYKMGHFMINGQLGFKSPEKAVTWYKMAAKQGHPRAQLAMARYCFTGEGTEQNDAEGAKWIKLAAEGGQAEARGFIGTLYLGAIGVKQDLNEGLKWLKEAKDSTALQRGLDLQQRLEGFAALTPEEKKASTDALAAEVKGQITQSWAEVKADLVKIDDTTPGEPDAKK
jgi:TPR repeat protein